MKWISFGGGQPHFRSFEMKEHEITSDHRFFNPGWFSSKEKTFFTVTETSKADDFETLFTND